MTEDSLLWLRVPEDWRGDVAQSRLGGTSIYAPDEESLSKGIREIGSAIVASARLHASLDRRSLLSLTASAIGGRLEQRLFDAILGGQLRRGRIDRIACEAEGGAGYRIVVASEQVEQFNARCEELALWLRKSRHLSIREVRDRFFGDGWGKWSSASHLAGRLVLIGRAQYVDRFTVAWPAGLEHAGR